MSLLWLIFRSSCRRAAANLRVLGGSKKQTIFVTEWIMNDLGEWVLKFTPSIEDGQAFYLYHHKHSPALRKQALTGQIVTTLVVFFGIILLFSFIYSTGPDTGSLSPNIILSIFLLALFLAGATFAFYPQAYISKIMKNAEKLHNERDGGYEPTECILMFSDSEIEVNSDVGESKIRWDAIEKIIIDGDYIYLYLDAVNAIIIPKRAFSDDAQHKEFIDHIEKVHAGTHLSSLDENTPSLSATA